MHEYISTSQAPRNLIYVGLYGAISSLGHWELENNTLLAGTCSAVLFSSCMLLTGPGELLPFPALD